MLQLNLAIWFPGSKVTSEQFSSTNQESPKFSNFFRKTLNNNLREISYKMATLIFSDFQPFPEMLQTAVTSAGRGCHLRQNYTAWVFSLTTFSFVRRLDTHIKFHLDLWTIDDSFLARDEDVFSVREDVFSVGEDVFSSAKTFFSSAKAIFIRFKLN
jgi:hypothetical protein